jgi:hypothetical protein
MGFANMVAFNEWYRSHEEPTSLSMEEMTAKVNEISEEIWQNKVNTWEQNNINHE